jgi:hypothetical protein
MAFSQSTFNTLEVRLFLNRKYPYAAQCFAQDFSADTVPSIQVEKWFKRYFPAELAFTEYRNLEANVTQTLQY